MAEDAASISGILPEDDPSSYRILPFAEPLLPGTQCGTVLFLRATAPVEVAKRLDLSVAHSWEIKFTLEQVSVEFCWDMVTTVPNSEFGRPFTHRRLYSSCRNVVSTILHGKDLTGGSKEA